MFHEPSKIVAGILSRLAPLIPDKQYLKWMFRLKMGYKLDLDNSKTFNEKLQWLKLYNRKPEYTQMVDKYAANLGMFQAATGPAFGDYTEEIIEYCMKLQK